MEKEAKAFTSPAEAIIARGVKIRIKDLDEFDQSELKPYAPASFTNYEVGVHGDKSIIVPSFGTTSAIFARHFATLRKLRRRVDLLKQSYYLQMDKERCWEHVDQIIDFMDKGFRFLAPEEILDEKNPAKNDVLYDDPNIENDELKLLKAQDLK
jgi:hypothetical protein